MGERDPTWLCPRSILLALVGPVVLVGIGYGAAETCNADVGSDPSSCDNGTEAVVGISLLLFLAVLGAVMLAITRRSWICRAVEVVQVLVVLVSLVAMF